MIKAEIGADNYNDRVEKDRWRVLGEGRKKTREAAGRPSQGDNVSDIHILRPSGISTTRIIARLKRDEPDIAEQLARGEFKSAAAAARVAGFKINPYAFLTAFLRMPWTALAVAWQPQFCPFRV